MGSVAPDGHQRHLRRSSTRRSRAVECAVAKEEEAITGVTMRAASCKRRRHGTLDGVSDESANPFDLLCDDLVLSILASLSCGARSPSHLIAVMLTCKRFHILAMQKKVLAHASKHALAVRASAWCKDADDFLRRCADSGNLEACFTLGMVKFYCTGEKREALRLLAKAAIAWHGAALFALAIMQFNGSGRKASDKNARVGVALCVRAAQAGSVEAIRELGHCFIEGQGLPRDVVAGRQLLLDANRKEAVQFVNSRNGSCSSCRCFAKVTEASSGGAAQRTRHLGVWKELLRRALLSDYGCAFPLRWLLQSAHPAHLFLVEWFAKRRLSDGGLRRVCSHALCGRPETRPLEFRQCAVCASAFYCSRSCQSTDWKLRHMLLCHASLPARLKLVYVLLVKTLFHIPKPYKL